MHFYDLGEWELFDLKKDPREMASVYADPNYAAVVKEMKAELARVRKQYAVPPAPKLRKGKTLFPPWAEFGTFQIGESDKSFTSLFDGKTLKGWHKPAGDSMKVVDGEIHISGDPQVFYLHKNQYTDFELELEAKMPAKDFDSGIGFRCVLAPGEKLPHGFQCEISDIRSGGIFDIGIGWTFPATEQDAIDKFVQRTGAFHKPGEWNQIRVRCQGSHIQTWINGQLCSDIQDAKHKRGAIGLQHNSKVPGTYRFRNIRIRELK